MFSFVEDGSNFTDIGLVSVSGTAIDADGLALSSTAGLFAFQLTEVNDKTGVPRKSKLISINPSTAAASVIGGWLERDIRGAAFDMSGSLWAIDALNDELLEVNPATGAVVGTPVGLKSGGTAFNVGNACDIALSPVGTPYVTNGGYIYNLNAATGALSLVRTDSGQAFAGAAFSIGAHYGDLFTYEINGTDDIYHHDATSGFVRSSAYTNIISSYNAGRGDLAALAVPEPLTMLGMFLGLGSVGAYIRKRRMS